MKPVTIKDLVIECLKQMDAGNGNKVVMIKNDTRFGKYNPVFGLFEDNTDVVKKNINTNNPKAYIMLG